MKLRKIRKIKYLKKYNTFFSYKYLFLYNNNFY